MDPRPFILLEAWFGLEVHLQDSLGLVLSTGRINSYKLDDFFQDGTLGDGFVGVTVLDVFVGNKETIMTHVRWPISTCWFLDGRSLKETADHFAANPAHEDPRAHLGGREKVPYRFVVRKPSLELKESQYDRKTQEDEIRKVSSERCCGSRCCQLFR